MEKWKVSFYSYRGKRVEKIRKFIRREKKNFITKERNFQTSSGWRFQRAWIKI